MKHLFPVAAMLAAITITACNTTPPVKKLAADADNAGLTLPQGFGALLVTDSIGAARHLAVNANGDIYVKLARLKNGRGIVVLSDKDGDGKAETQSSFGGYGGTGMYIKNGYLYTSSNTDVYRYKLNDQQLVADTANPEVIASGLISRRQHNTKSLVLDDSGYVYVNIGAFSNACQAEDRTKGSPGMQPCPILDSAAGIWRFRADGKNQGYHDGLKYATGIRNVVGLDWNTASNALVITQHGRDGLHDLYPDLYDTKLSAELPAEAMYQLKQGDDCGWPYIYYDQIQKKKILAPEYGGDGKKEGGANAIDPIVTFPGHLAPNGLLFYTGNMFPEKYKNGAFIAFHGSWNRAPEKQAGFNVAFVPFANGKPSGEWEVFADGFAGKAELMAPGEAKHRPCGLAQGPDGSLYVSDDVTGAIYRIIYNK